MRVELTVVEGVQRQVIAGLTRARRQQLHRSAAATLEGGASDLVLVLWRRLPPKQRKQALALARKHGPKAAAKLMQLRRARRGRL